MSLIFGNLTQDFVNFSIAIQSINRNDPQSSSLIEEAARNFRHVAAEDASYLTYIGTWIPIAFGSHRCHCE
jgi:ATP-binding cassette subfamily B (MDR/TAP) protein 1